MHVLILCKTKTYQNYLFSSSLVADPHHAPDHFFTAPFDSENIGPSTSKLQTLMQVS